MMKDSMKELIHQDFVLQGLPEPPNNYTYETREHNRTFIGIWLHCHHRFSYNGGAPVYTIWGFYNRKTRQYHSPINSSKPGDVVRIEDTRPYTSMPLNLNPLMQCLMSPS